MAKVRNWVILSALMALTLPAFSEPGDEMPSVSLPALAAAPLFYALVPNPFGARTWAEQQLEAIRLGGREVTEDASAQTSFVLLALHTKTTEEYALEMMEAPKDVPAGGRAITTDRPVLALAEEGAAFEAMGLSPEELVAAPEIPAGAYTVADTLARLYDWGVGQTAGLRERVRGSTQDSTTQYDPTAPRAAAPLYVEYKKPVPDDHAKSPPLRFTKRAVRSGYKIALGVAIGVLIWGFVRNTPQ